MAPPAIQGRELAAAPPDAKVVAKQAREAAARGKGKVRARRAVPLAPENFPLFCYAQAARVPAGTAQLLSSDRRIEHRSQIDIRWPGCEG